MAATKQVTLAASAATTLHNGGDDVVTSVVFQVSSASSLSTIPRAAVDGSGQTPANVAYYNVLTGATVSAGTAITANGVYAVYAPGCVVDVNTSAGSATVDIQRLIGKAF